MRKIIIIKNKQTQKITVKIAKIKDIDIVGNLLFLFTKKGLIHIIDNSYNHNKVIIQDYTGNNIKQSRYFQNL